MTKNLESRLLGIAALFLILYGTILTLSPAVRERTWLVDYRWQHWISILVWALAFLLLRRVVQTHLPNHDPYLLPIFALLTGWGLLTVSRLTPGFGLRQTIWLAISTAGLIAALKFRFELEILRRYKYVLLSLGLFLTALTIIFGTNPAGTGPRLWLGCCGIYLQPSEPLKLLMISYLAAYLADRLPAINRLIPLLLPTIVVTGLALLLLLFQRDLGTASIFILLYAIIVYVGTGHRRVLVLSTALLIIAGLGGYYFIDLIRLRIDSWLNPWLDPSGNSYQIIQSLLAIANGGTLGRGPGLGSPTLVPISHSDFIFTAIGEELGLAGILGILALIALLVSRAARIAMLARSRFQRLLAVGIAAYLTIQSLLIIGGNLRVLPLTGVTLPFVSYGGSSLLTAFVAMLALLLISDQSEEDPAPLPDPSPYLVFHGILCLGIVIMSFGAGWWILYRGADLLTRTDNARRSISDRFVRRGSLVDRNNLPINITEGERGSYTRQYLYPDLGPITGYTHPIYGQAGLEASLDQYLRGLRGNPASLIWWDHLLYGTPPPGIDMRLSIDLSLQTIADEMLGDHPGAVLLLNAETGEVLVMASHPGFDPNLLDEQVATLTDDGRSPLLNRATQGQYSPQGALEPFSLVLLGKGKPATQLETTQLYAELGFLSQPAIRMPLAESERTGEDLQVNPLQMALAAAAITNQGILPAPRIVLAANTPQEGWVILPASGSPRNIFSPEGVENVLGSLTDNNLYWEYTGIAEAEPLTWHLSGTLPGWKGSPIVITVVIEGNNPTLARSIAEELLRYSRNQ
jgi:cell division protein FtsW (lipid II flippase)